MNRQDFRFFHRLRVRWAEVDMQKIVFNAHYLMYFDTAVADYWRALALPYEEAMQLLEGDLYVRKATVEFNASARMDDRLDIGLKCGRIGNSSMTFAGAIFRGDELLVTCELVYVFADPATQRSKAVPTPLRALLHGFEKAEATFGVKTGSWADLGGDAQRIRTAVFVEEPRIPADLEWDDADTSAVHAVAYNRLGQAVGTGRLVPQAPGIARIGRMAVHRAIRGAGVGQGLLDALLGVAARRGDHEAVLHAQCSAEAFYAGAGFLPRGEPFEEAGIAHIEMTRPLRVA
jgi:YbgC/YbaW family acyl-CoA thioester hydrolase